MKKKTIICSFIIIFIVLAIILIIRFYNYGTDEVAKVNINVPSLIESSTHYTFHIYKKGNSGYTYKKVETEMWINKITSQKIVALGNIKSKEQLSIIQKDIEENSWDNLLGLSNVGIYYKDEELSTLEELAEKLF